MLNFPHLKYPPIKYKLPDKLIYHSTIYSHNFKIEKFDMFSTNANCKAHGEMYCFKEKIYRPDTDFVPSLYIDFLFSSDSGKGFGTSLLNFARNHSKQIGCNGRLHLMAISKKWGHGHGRGHGEFFNFFINIFILIHINYFIYLLYFLNNMFLLIFLFLFYIHIFVFFY